MKIVKKISLVATYNADNRHTVETITLNPALESLHEVILVNEGNAENIEHNRCTSIRITDFAKYREPLVMAVGAHYASGDVIVLCRNPCGLTERVYEQMCKARRRCSPCPGINVFMRSDLPWEYDIETGFQKGEKGRFINLTWEVVNVAR